MKIIDTYLVRSKNGLYIDKVHELQNGEYVLETNRGAGITFSCDLTQITKEKFEELKKNWK